MLPHSTISPFFMSYNPVAQCSDNGQIMAYKQVADLVACVTKCLNQLNDLLVNGSSSCRGWFIQNNEFWVKGSVPERWQRCCLCPPQRSWGNRACSRIYTLFQVFESLSPLLRVRLPCRDKPSSTESGKLTFRGSSCHQEVLKNNQVLFA